MRASERMLRRNLATALGLVLNGVCRGYGIGRICGRQIADDSETGLCSECEERKGNADRERDAWEQLDQQDATEWARGVS